MLRKNWCQSKCPGRFHFPYKENWRLSIMNLTQTPKCHWLVQFSALGFKFRETIFLQFELQILLLHLENNLVHRSNTVSCHLAYSTEQKTVSSWQMAIIDEDEVIMKKIFTVHWWNLIKVITYMRPYTVSSVEGGGCCSRRGSPPANSRDRVGRATSPWWQLLVSVWELYADGN